MPAVLVFYNDGDLDVFPSLQHAGGWMEAIDVDGGEYAAAFLHDGTVVDMRTAQERVVLTPTAKRDPVRLDRWGSTDDGFETRSAMAAPSTTPTLAAHRMRAAVA